MVMRKYHNKILQTPEGIFHSVKEYDRWNELKLLQRAGKISDLQRQVRFTLIPSQRADNGKVIEFPVFYIADFAYTENGKQVVEDAKGAKTKEYVIKRKLMLFVHGIQIKETY